MIHAISRELLVRYAPLQPIDATGILIHQATDLYCLWEAIENDVHGVCDPPFWGIVWPGARLLANFLVNNRSMVVGKTVLDIGAGCALVAIAALRIGAHRAIANDIDPMALSVAQLNASANDVKLTTDHCDLTMVDTPEIPDIVTAADMFYEANTATPLYTLLYNYHKKGAMVFIADGNRPFTPRERLTLLTTSTYRVDNGVEGKSERITSLYQITD